MRTAHADRTVTALALGAALLIPPAPWSSSAHAEGAEGVEGAPAPTPAPTPTPTASAAPQPLAPPAVVAADGSVPVDAGAGAYPARVVDRPINLRAGMVQVDARYQYLRVDAPLFGAVGLDSVGFGASIGLSDRAQLLVTHERSPGIDTVLAGGLVMAVGDEAPAGRDRFGALTLGGRYALSQQADFDLSIEVGVGVPVARDGAFGVSLGVPARARLAPRFALDFAPALEVAIYKDGERPEGDLGELLLAVPVSGVLSITDRVFVAGRSGLSWQLTADAGMFEAFSFPLFLELGGTVLSTDAMPAIDVSVEAGFPQLLRPSADDAVGTELMVVRANLSVALRP